MEANEYTLESWRAERQKLEAEMAADSAQLKAAMEEALANDNLPSEMKRVIRESGSKLLEADDWLREMYDSTEDTIKRCDELIAKADALEARRGGYATAEEIRENLFGFIPAVRHATGLPAVQGSRVERDESNGDS